MYNEEVRNKLRWIISKVNHEIDGECYVYMSRLEGEWYHNISVNFNYSNLQINISISEGILATQTADAILSKVINGIKAEILSNYFK